MMAEEHGSSDVDRARAANEAMLNGYWQRAMVALVEGGVPWGEAAMSMLTIAAQNVEHANGIDVAELSLTAAAGYMASKREASDKLDKIASGKGRH